VALGARETTLPSTEEPTAVTTQLSTLVTRVFRETAKPVPTLVTRVLHEPATVVQRVRSHRAVHRGRLAVAALAAVTLIALVGGSVFAIAGGDPPGVNAPDAVGSSVAHARAEVARRARDAGVPVPKVKVVQRAYSESAPNGVVVRQDPPEGERIPERGALLVSISLGSAFTDVPSVAGLASKDAQSLLERTGFVPAKRYAPSTEIAAWHAVESDPPSGTRVKRPAHVRVTISTGPPRIPVPGVDELAAPVARKAVEDAGFTVRVQKVAKTDVDPGTVIGVSPDVGTRAQLGSTVTLTVARAPRWTPLERVEGTEDAEPQSFEVPAGARLVLTTVDTSPLGLFGGEIDVSMGEDSEGQSRVRAGEALVLADVASKKRTIEVGLDVHGSVHWALAVEEPR
jgi:beta-lactam-binding protein with PASTA domain